MSNGQDLYTILGVSPTATIDDIRSAYRTAARRLHPDMNPNPGAANQFKDIASAYEVLGDPVSRDKYDNSRRGGSAEAPYFSLRVVPSKRILPLLDEPQVLYVLAELTPERGRTKEQASINLNLTLVVDRSNSMSGVRLERVRAAAFQIIDNLTPQDMLSIVAFSDRAEVLVPAGPVNDKSTIKAMLSTMQANGATEIFQGLDAGFKENQRHGSKRFVNHIILLTDGRTYGDEALCLELADKAAISGIGISAMGLGDEWNDEFLDKLATRTGGNSEYINTVNAVVRFMNDRVRALGRSLAERVMLSLAPDSDVKLESAFRLSPSAQPVDVAIDPIPLGQLQVGRNTSAIFQLQIPENQRAGFRSIMRVDVTADILREGKSGYKMVADLSLEFSDSAPVEEPPVQILDALGKLALYRMQQKADAALAAGNIREATKHLETLATRLLTAGQHDLANAAIAEARRVSGTNMISEDGRKALKYGTRLLLAPPQVEGMQTTDLQ